MTSLQSGSDRGSVTDHPVVVAGSSGGVETTYRPTVGCVVTTVRDDFIEHRSWAAQPPKSFRSVRRGDTPSRVSAVVVVVCSVRSKLSFTSE